MSNDAKRLRVVNDHNSLPAGTFTTWLRATRDARLTGGGIDVPCGACNACCRASFFIHIAPDETDALAHIPKALLFPAPGLPKGNVVMGYDERGHCPMLTDGKCSIYAHRPRTCRSFDCRVFAAAGLTASEDDDAPIAVQSRRWQFSYATDDDRTQHAAVSEAAQFLQTHAKSMPGSVPSNPAQLAMLAVEVSPVFAEPESSRTPARRETPAFIRAVAAEKQQFDARRSKSSQP